MSMYLWGQLLIYDVFTCSFCWHFSQIYWFLSFSPKIQFHVSLKIKKRNRGQSFAQVFYFLYYLDIQLTDFISFLFEFFVRAEILIYFLFYVVLLLLWSCDVVVGICLRVFIWKRDLIFFARNLYFCSKMAIRFVLKGCFVLRCCHNMGMFSYRTNKKSCHSFHNPLITYIYI